MPIAVDTVEPTEPPLRTLGVATSRPVPDLQAATCSGGDCWWADGARIVPFDPITLEPAGATAPHGLVAVHRLDVTQEAIVATGRCPTQPTCTVSWSRDGEGVSLKSPLPGMVADPMDTILTPPDDGNAAVRERAVWVEIMDQQQRLPFHRRVPVAQGGMVTYQRSLGQGSGKLMRVGGGIRSVDVVGTGHDFSCEGWLASHPSGLELYLLPWPRPILVAYDAISLAKRWEIELPGPAQGLFVDPGGRFMLLSLTGVPDPNRLTDHPAVPLEPGLPGERLSGRAALPPDGPEPIATLLLDLAAKAVVTQTEGSFRAWFQAPGQATLLATDHQLLRLEPPG